MADKKDSSKGPLTTLGALMAVAGLGFLFPGPRDVGIALVAKLTGVPNPDVPIWIPACVLLVGVVLVLLDWGTELGFGKSKQLLALKHISLSDMQPASLDERELPRRNGRLSLEQVSCDLTAEIGHGQTEIAAAALKQQRVMQGLAQRLQTTPRPRLAYYGIAHIPFQLWAGCQLTHSGAYLFELVRESGAWRELVSGKIKKFPIEVKRTLVEQTPAALVIRIAVSFPVDLADVKDVVPDPFDDVLITVDNPRRDLITHYKQAEALALAFREALDQGMQRLASGGNVHVFYAGPMSVGFELGRQVSVSNHPSVLVYNHNRQSSPRYAWAICINQPHIPNIIRFPEPSQTP